MKKLLIVLLGLAFLAGLAFWLSRQSTPASNEAAAPLAPLAPVSSAEPPPGIAAESKADEEASDQSGSLLYGIVTLHSGQRYEGRLRFGGDEEASWTEYFNGVKVENRWASYLSGDQLSRPREPRKLLGLEIARPPRKIDLERPFQVQFGQVERIEREGKVVSVTLQGGRQVDLNRHEAGDFDDGVRVWDTAQGEVDLSTSEIRTIELQPAPPQTKGPRRLYGTVRTQLGTFTGWIVWNRYDSLGSDKLSGRSDGKPFTLRYGELRSLAQGGSAQGGSDQLTATLQDGSQLSLSGSQETGDGHRGIYVEDGRFGRVLVSWGAFEQLDFEPDPGSPGYESFGPGRPLTGAVTTRGGRRLAGRLVFDLDESETTDTLDAPFRGLSYTIPFGRIAKLELPREEGSSVQATLTNGETLQLERAVDLGDGNGGALVFPEGSDMPEYVLWGETAWIEFDRPELDRPELDRPQ